MARGYFLYPHNRGCRTWCWHPLKALRHYLRLTPKNAEWLSKCCKRGDFFRGGYHVFLFSTMVTMVDGVFVPCSVTPFAVTTLSWRSIPTTMDRYRQCFITFPHLTEKSLARTQILPEGEAQQARPKLRTLPPRNMAPVEDKAPPRGTPLRAMVP